MHQVILTNFDLQELAKWAMSLLNDISLFNENDRNSISVENYSHWA